MRIDDYRISVFPEYHSMGRLINNVDNKQVGVRANDVLYFIDAPKSNDNFCLSYWFLGPNTRLNDLQFCGDKQINNLVIQNKIGISNIFINGKHIDRTSILLGEKLEIEIGKSSHTTSDHSPLRDFRYYERSLSEKELEEVCKFCHFGFPDIHKSLKSYIEIYASNAANMFPTHF